LLKLYISAKNISFIHFVTLKKIAEERKSEIEKERERERASKYVLF